MLLRILISLLAASSLAIQVYSQSFVANQLHSLSWETDLKTLSYPDGKQSYIKVIAIPGGYAYLSVVDNAIHEFDGQGDKIGLVPIDFKPLNFTFYQGVYYVQGFYHIQLIDRMGKRTGTIPYPQTIKSTMNLTVENNQLRLVLPNNNTWVYNTGKKNSHEEEGIALSTSGTVKAIRKNNHQYELLYEKGKQSHCFSFTTENKLGAILFHGMVQNKWVVEIEEIVQEQPLVVTRKLLLIDPLDAQVKSVIIIPHQRYVFAPHDVVVANDRILVSLATETQSLLYEITIGPTYKPFADNLFENPAHFNSTK